ncbi:MAG TPA: hypothetical protein VGC44_00280 [Longimicrobiales bacterium]
MPNRMWRVAVGVFLVGLVFDFLLYGVLLESALRTDRIVRIPWDGAWPKIPAGELIFSIAFAWIYVRGIEALPALGQGLRFGLALAFLFAVAGGLQIAPMIPTTETIIIGSIAGNAVKVLVQGLVAGVLAGSGSGRT